MTMIVGFCTVIATLLSYLRMPTIVGFIISGLLITYFGIVENFPGIKMINEVGLSLLMFTVGLEFSAQKIRRLSKSMLGLGGGMIVSVIVIVTLFGWGLNIWSFPKSLMIGMILSLSSSAIVLKMLQKRRELETPHGNASVGVLLAQDIVFAPMIMAIPFVFGEVRVGDQTSSDHILFTFLTIVGYCGGLIVFTRYLLNPLFSLILKSRSQELFYFLLFFLFALIAFSTEKLIGSLSLGSFIAGLCFANSPLSKQALSDILPLRDTFLALLFASVGMLVDISFFVEHIGYLLLVTVAVFILKPTVVYVIGRVSRLSHGVSLTVGLLSFQIGEFSIVLIKELSRNHHFSPDDMQFFLSITVLTMALTPFVYKITPWIVKKTEFLETWSFFRSVSPSSVSAQGKQAGVQAMDHSMQDHTIIIGYGVAGRKLGDVLSSLSIPYVALDMNFVTVREAQKKNLPVFFGDGGRQEILHVAGIEQARCLVITIPSVVVARHIVSTASAMRLNLPMIVRVEYERGIDALRHYSHVQIVVAEYESTLQLLAQTLDSYAIAHNTIKGHLEDIKSSWNSCFAHDSSSSTLPFMGSSNLKFHRVTSTSFVVGRPLKQLELNHYTKAWIVAIQKETSHSFIPTSDYVLRENDTLIISAQEEEFGRAQVYLEQGPAALQQVES